jgi:hypothetical protein
MLNMPMAISGKASAKSTTPLDLHFSFLKRHYFRASYMGVGFVDELINIYFKAVPFRIRAEDMFTRCGHQEFFLADTFGLGCLLGELLGRVEVLITSLHFQMTDIIQPLMAIGNTDCLIELTAPNAVTTVRCLVENKAITTSQQFFHTISLNSRRMKLKGYPVIVRYQGITVFTANERDDLQTVSA